MFEKTQEVNEMTITLNELLFEIRLSINKIKFCKDQLNILQVNLESLVKFYAESELMPEVEQYQNKFIVYRELSDKLIKESKSIRNKTTESKVEKTEDLDSEILEEFDKFKILCKDYFTFFEDLKKNFIHFYTSYHVSENHIAVKDKKISDF